MTLRDFFIKRYEIDLKSLDSHFVQEIMQQCAYAHIECPIEEEIQYVKNNPNILYNVFYWPYRRQNKIPDGNAVFRSDVMAWAWDQISQP